jgi:hypothetical protein
MKKEKADIFIPPNLDNPPEDHEIDAAWIIARHYNCLVRFLKPIIGYKVRTADFVIQGVLWELKSPVSASRRRCVTGQFDRAAGQSRSIIFDARRTKLEDNFLKAQLQKELQKRHSIQRLVFISKDKEVVALK